MKFKRITAFIGAIASSVLFSACTFNLNFNRPNSSDGHVKDYYICDFYKDYFPIGAAVTTDSYRKYADQMPHFNSVTAEYQMKWGQLEKEQGNYSYTIADKLINEAKKAEQGVRGHCLLWYKSLPKWIKQTVTTKEQALNLIDSHVRETMTHFGDSVYCWDVLNEAISSSVTDAQLQSGNFYRTGGSKFDEETTFDWYATCGFDFIERVFTTAAQVREELNLPDLDLYYNDYSLNNPNKREACLRMIQRLQQDHVPIDGVGMQAHYRLPNYEADTRAFLNNFERSIRDFTALGVDVQITELDICIYETNNESEKFDELSYSAELKQAEMYKKIFEICRKYATPWARGAGKVTGVTTWGIADDTTAQDTEYHKEYPLIFGTNHEPKQAYYEITDF